MFSVIGPVYVFVCFVSVSSITAEDFVETWYYDWAYKSEESVNFWWWSDPEYGTKSLIILPHYCRMGHFRRFIIISDRVTGQFS